MSDLRTFELALDAFADQDIPGGVRDLRNAVALEALRGVVLLSPVDKGFLRGSWEVTTGSPVDPGLMEQADKAGFSTISMGTAALEAIVSAYELVYVGSRAPYAVFVNDGTPKVTAVHMVEQTVSRLERMLG